LLFTTNDVIGNEETVHYAMLQASQPRSVLLLSGGASGMPGEILKYPSVERIDNVEQNRALIEIVGQYTAVSTDKRINRFFTDGLRFLKKTGSRYDVAIVAVPGPSSLQYNRFYTASFFELLKKRMNEKGVVSVGMPPSGNYLMPETVNAAGPVYQAMKKYFANVIIVPGEKDYFLASDGPLSPAIAELAAEKNIEATYVNPFYIDDLSLKHRGEQLAGQLADVSLINTDERPVPVFYQTLRYIGQFSNRQLLVLMVPALFLLIPLFFMSPVSGGMYITGFTASSLEVLLLFLFQVVFGYLYSAIGLIIALFMGGLALGGFAGYRLKTGRLHFLIAQTLLGVFAALIPLFWMLLKNMQSGAWGWVVFIVITLIPATLTGFQYVASTQQHHSSRVKGASVIYSADLLGGALGTVLVTLVLVPFLGIKNSCFVLAAANGVVVFVHVLRNRKRVFD
jgi:spermidine synthase